MHTFSNGSANKLYNSPVFAGSLGSKELFHSNIWAFLIEQDESFLKVFFEGNGYDENDKVEDVKREKYHMDLIIETINKVFIIENKIKSIPYKEQLIGYERTIESIKDYREKKRFFLLTGIGDNEPSFLKVLKEKGEINDWKYLSYISISKRILNSINESINKTKATKAYYPFAREYADNLLDISLLLSDGIKGIKNYYYFPQFKDIDKGFYENVGVISEIEKLRLGDIFQKMNAERFVQKVKDDFISKERFNELLKCQSGFTRQYSLAEFFFEKTRYRKSTKTNKVICEYVRIGVQIQETQFRWYIETKTEEGKTVDSVFDSACKEKTWFDEEPLLNHKAKKQSAKQGGKSLIKTPTSGEPKETSMTTKKCKFQTTTNTFVYQYFDIHSCDCRFEVLANMVVDFMRKADGLVESIKTLID